MVYFNSGSMLHSNYSFVVNNCICVIFISYNDTATYIVQLAGQRKKTTKKGGLLYYNITPVSKSLSTSSFSFCVAISNPSK